MSLIRADPEEMEKTKMEKRVFLIVLDSFGIGAEPDAAAFGDEGTNTPVSYTHLDVYKRQLRVIEHNEGGANKDLAKFADQINALCDKWDD